VPSGNRYQRKYLASEIVRNPSHFVDRLRYFEDSAGRLYHPLMSLIRRLGALAAASALAATPALAQSATDTPLPLTAADYARAERFMTYNATPLVLHTGVRPSWLPGDAGDRFWYRVTTEKGVEVVLIDPAKATRSPCDLAPCRAAEREEPARAAAAGGRYAEMSPDRQRSAFVRDWNLWVRDVATGRETQLTRDGVKDFGYATDNAGWERSDRPILRWSPDSKKIATFQQDQRGVGEMYLVDTTVGHPALQAWKYPLPGDTTVTMIQRVVIDVDTGKIVRLQLPPDQHRSTLCDDVACRGDWGDVQWSPDGSTVAFVSTARDHRREQLRVADAATGIIRDVLEEKAETFYESGNGAVNWRYLPASNEVIWFSERDNWGHLYLHDLKTGREKNAITTGNGNVTQLLRVDEKARQLYFIAVGREQGRDPYFRHLYRVNMDGKGLQLLTPDDGDHDVSWSPSGRFFVDTWSKPDLPPTSQLRDADGKLVLTLEKADITRLVAAGWKPPVPITVKARDGVTDLYGLMYKPTSLDPAKKYPIVNHIYPGPQTGSVGGRTFSPARGDAQALAELGFIVVEIDGMGTPWRSKKFHEAYYGNMGDNTLPDQVAGMKELASRFPWIDIDRAGIYGHSGGGYAAADAMFRYPDFFKVGISEAGNHDNRVYEDDWAEKWQGLLEKRADGTTNYDNQANQLMAKNLKGKLLLAHGTLDTNVPPNNTLLVVNELIKANKDFDLLMLPNRGHGFGNEGYMVRRRWDYFVRHLLGVEPPREYQMHSPADSRQTP
jgi:dipeptidyl aminopeptidase/acylaminoacyl peptidase